MDRNLFDFANLKATGVADADGDIAFDEDACASTAGMNGINGDNVIALHLQN